jgi:C4-dicarboxylate-specific signal transduction histidine kinase
MMLANGEHPKIVQERLKHADVSMNKEFERRVVERIGEPERATTELRREIAERRRTEEQARVQAQVIDQVQAAVVTTDMRECLCSQR